MNHLRHIFAAVATLVGAGLALAATPAALATQVPPSGGDHGVAPPPPVRVIADGGMPGWQVTLIALAAALVAAAVAVLFDRAWAARKTHAPTA